MSHEINPTPAIAEQLDAVLRGIRLQYQQFFTSDEAAEFVRMSRRSFDDWVRENEVPFAPDHDGKRSKNKYHRRDLIAAMCDRKRPHTSASAAAEEIRRTIHHVS